MRESDNVELMVGDAMPYSYPVEHYPVALVNGQQILRDGKVVATVDQTCMVHTEAHMLAYIAARNRSVEIAPAAANIRIEVGPDGVHIGFFTDDGQSAILNLDAISRGQYGAYLGSEALRAWATDRRKQAKRLAG